MPELPEVETVVLGLKEVLVGHRIRSIVVNQSKSFAVPPSELKQLLGSEIKGVRRLGKVIVIDLDNQDSLLVHLKLTGQLVYRNNASVNKNFGGGHPTDSLVGHLPDKTTRVIFQLDGGGALFFNDMRKFGWIKLLHTRQIIESDPVRKLGPDALAVTCEHFVQLFQKRQKNIKACLLDQSIIAGCGNIYADEALWSSKIHPQKSAGSLKKSELSRLWQELQRVLKHSIEKGGTSSKNYINSLGAKGNYLKYINVYQKTGQPCKRCQTNIKRIVVAGRGTHICESCQSKS